MHFSFLFIEAVHNEECVVPPSPHSSLKGVPLAYDDIRIVGRHGDIYDDSGYVHMDIMANFIVFQPQKGQKLLVSGVLQLLPPNFAFCTKLVRKSRLF